MSHYICIHGHFYQPPRENPWLEEIEIQDSAYPYHDWNEKITAECYGPNASSRILDDQKRILDIVNNYAKMSFNFGPTLLSWMEKNASDVYQAIRIADVESQRRFSGHGSALAQAYNHIIMPLANSRDKLTQVMWGILDFKHRFGRKPEGMWLPETAVDLETLDIMANLGIRFTILSPYQACRVRPLGNRRWRNVNGGKINITIPYVIYLPSGKSISLFFYDAPISQAIAFEGLLESGQSFVKRLMNGFSKNQADSQLVHVASDGETYGHHYRLGDITLTYVLDHIENETEVQLTNYGEYLEKNPPTHEVEIFENTTWSCAHGIERWRNDCGCNTGKRPQWNQAWRKPLHEAFDWLRDRTAAVYEKNASNFLKDPWAARNDYIRLILHQSAASLNNFLKWHAKRSLKTTEKTTVLNLLELQRSAVYMYTSCGWFFDDISGVEAIQNLRYASRVIQLSQKFLGQDLESGFIVHLQKAKSNDAKYGNGQRIYARFVKPAVFDFKRACANYAISILFDNESEKTSIGCLKIKRKDYQVFTSESARAIVGKARIIDELTREYVDLKFGAFHLGNSNIRCGVKESEKDIYPSITQALSDVFVREAFDEIHQVLVKYLENMSYSLTSLFLDNQRKILKQVLKSSLRDVESVFRRIYEKHAPIMRLFNDLGSPLPRELAMTAKSVINNDLQRYFEAENIDSKPIKAALKEAKVIGIALDSLSLEFVFRKRLEHLAAQLFASPRELARVQKLKEAIGLLNDLPFTLNLWKVQKDCFKIYHTTHKELLNQAKKGDQEAQRWVLVFDDLTEKLSMFT